MSSLTVLVLLVACGCVGAAWGATASDTRSIAVLGKRYTPDRINMLKHATTTFSSSWTFVAETDEIPDDMLAKTLVCLDCSLSLLGKMPHAVLYQYSYTGFDDNDLALIPIHMAVANCHQSVDSIAEYVMGAMLEFAIGLRSMDATFRECTWNSQSPGNNCPSSLALHRTLKGATLGIIGYGSIGKGVALRANAFGMRIIATTLHPPATTPPPLAWLGGDDMNAQLMKEADYVMIACPLNNSTRGLVDKTLMALMKPTAVIINIARGPIIDEDALWWALSSASTDTSSRIAGAVIDVWWHPNAWETKGGTTADTWPSKYPFNSLGDKVVLTPHSSAHTEDDLIQAMTQVAANLDNLALGRPLVNVVRNATLRLPGY